MREILFRGFYPDESRKTTITINETKVKGLWVFGYYVFRRARSGVFGQTVTDSDFDKHIIVTNRGESYEVVPETVGQYTGLKDKNGKKIFEGDIIKDCLDEIGIIEYKPKRAAFVVKNWEDGYILWTQDNIEVIGNIFENPELLEEK